MLATSVTCKPGSVDSTCVVAVLTLMRPSISVLVLGVVKSNSSGSRVAWSPLSLSGL